MIFALSVVVLAGAVLLASRAVANGYLQVMRFARYGTVVLEHGPDELYHVVTPTRVPLALVRYLALCAAYSVVVLFRRLPAWGDSRKTVPLTAKA